MIIEEEIVKQMAREEVEPTSIFNSDYYYRLANGNCWRLEYYWTGWSGWTADQLKFWPWLE